MATMSMVSAMAISRCRLRDGGVAVVAYKNGKSLYDYFVVTMPDGTQSKRSLSEIKSLLQ